MRTRKLALAVTAATTTAAAGLTVTPAGAAAAAVTVEAINHAGTKAEVPGSVVSLSTGRKYPVNPSAPAQVPPGRYVVGAYVIDYPRLTVAVHEVNVTGNTSVVFDTAKAQQVTFNVGDSTVAPAGIAAVPFVKVAGKEQKFIPEVGVQWPAAATYVLPDGGAKDVRLAIHGVLTHPGSDPSPVRYDLVESVAGMPSAVSFATTAPKLARVELDVATLDEDHNAFLTLIPAPAKAGGPPTDGVDLPAPVPGHLISYRTAGLQWGTQLNMNNLHSSAFLEEKQKEANLIYAAGQTYRESWGSGVWGPHPAGPAIYLDQGTLKVIGGPPICALSGVGVKLTGCQLQPQTATYQLHQDRKSLGQGASVSAKIDDSKPHWYVAELSASRQNVGDLSTEITARWYFQAGGVTITRVSPTESVRSKLQVQPGYLRLEPAGLDEHHRAAAGSVTTLAMSVLDFPETTAMTLDYSTDAGKSWHSVKLTRTGQSWAGKITNPAAPGKVSLRAGAVARSGATVSETITNAYGLR